MDTKTETKDGKDSSAKDTDEVLAAQVLAAADRFQVADLLTFCSEKLSQNITISNAVTLLKVLEATNATLLKV